MRVEPTVFVVDDDEALRESLGRLMESVDLPCEAYPSAEAFLAGYDRTRPGCLILDVRMPGMGGLELQEKLAREGITIPVIIISGHGDVDKAVRAMKIGAVDFINKPYEGPVLLDAIREAFERDAELRRTEAERAEVATLFAALTPREREVMDLLVTGKTPKEIAFQLGVSRKTVDVYRSHIRIKLCTDSLVELVRMAQIYAAGAEPAPHMLPER